MKMPSQLTKILLCLTMTCGLAHADGLDFSLEKVNNHILKLREREIVISEMKSDNAQASTTTLKSYIEALGQSENYASGLSEYLIEQYNDGGVDPYALNLVHEFIRYQITLHQKIQKLSAKDDHLLVLSLQAVTLKKIQDLFVGDKGLRRIVSDQVEGHSYKLSEWNSLVDSILDKKNIKSLESKVRSAYFPLSAQLEKEESKERLEILKSFQGSPLNQALKKEMKWTKVLDRKEFWINVGDGVQAGLGSITTSASSAFGLVAGSIAWREGYLKEDKKLLSYLDKNLKPFDLLTEKKAYKFTDLTIPGHWGHLGVYLGTKEQLQELGLWDSPEIAPFKSSIENGKTIFQVRRWGLVFDSVRDFINLDEMAVLRVENFTEKPASELKLVFDYLASQMGKSYDFSFDAMTGENITCTEIVAFSYGPIKWPMEYLLGRYTISPNNMAELAFHTGAPLKTVAYITGDKQGTHYRSEAEFGRTLNYELQDGVFKKYSLECEREMYRHRRSGIRFQYSCDDLYTEIPYANQ